MANSILILGIFCFLLFSAVVSDIVSYAMPCWPNGAIFALFINFVLAASIEGRPIAWPLLRLHLLGGPLLLGAGITLFAACWIGGGDAKMFAVA
jgi:prepilin peptidase CpaA